MAHAFERATGAGFSGSEREMERIFSRWRWNVIMSLNICLIKGAVGILQPGETY